MLKRVCIVFLALAFVASATMQLMPHALAAPARADAGAPCETMDMKADVAATPAEMPCKGKILDCATSIGCAVFVDVPARPQAAAAAVHWTEAIWSAVQPSLAGLTLEPELTPPIAVL